MVQLVHIKGPLQGEIQEFVENEIFIGRHPSCHVQFPKDLAIISRKHARILRDGNRFKLLDQSANGTFLNGKKVQEAYLKDGDVIIFADDGPKISFLTQTLEGQPPIQPRSASEKPGMPVSPPAPDPLPAQPAKPVEYTSPSPQPLYHPPAGAQTSERKKVPLTIQFGPTLRTFDELPITIGGGHGCDFILEHPEVLDRHVQIFYSQEQYWVKDLTGQNRVFINRRAIDLQAPLQSDNRLSLGPRGPSFRFLGAGRLAEIEEPAPQAPKVRTPRPEPKKFPKTSAKKPVKGTGDIIKKFFKR